MTTHLVHLTKPNKIDSKKVMGEDILVKILKERKLIGSTTESGFIVGDRRAVCFQESPLYSLSQNIYYERKLSKKRYCGLGIMFHKALIYKKGGRPVIYDKTFEAKEYLPSNQWWRIVNYDLSDKNNIVDWTHEREWRVPGDLEFKLNNISIVVPNSKAYKNIINKCNYEGIDIVNEVKSIISLADLFL